MLASNTTEKGLNIQVHRKRRAGLACQQCRKRKVRCNLEIEGIPCTNCQLDRETCIAATNRRQRAVKLAHRVESSSSEVSNHVTNQQYKLLSLHTEARIVDSGFRQAATPSSTSEGWPPNQCQFMAPRIVPDRQVQLPEGVEVVTGAPSTATPSIHQQFQDLDTSAVYPGQNLMNESRVDLPAYVQSLPSRIPPDDVIYLRAKRSLELPSTKLRNSLIRSYVDWVHPFCPCLDLAHFLRAIEATDGSRGTVSLLVLQAALHAGSTFVDISCLHEAGYPTRLAARKDFFTRSKCLYDLKYENDRLQIVQALLLMSYWQEEHDEAMNHWYWTSLACNTARSIGLYADPIGSAMNPEEAVLWKRVGWSCFLRDSVINLGVRQPPTIRPGEFTISSLEESDFGIMEYDSAVVSMLGNCDVLSSVSSQVRLARMCIAKTKLCVLIGEIFATQYVAMTPKLGARHEITLILMPIDPASAEPSRGTIQSKLDRWSKDLPNELQQQVLPSEQLRPGEQVLFLHLSLLHMFHGAILLTLYRPWMARAAADSPNLEVAPVRRRLHQAAANITRRCEDLQNENLVCMLPSMSITTLLTAAVNHLVESKTASGAQAEQCLRRFWDCLAYLKTLLDVHVYAKYASIFLTSLAQQTGIFLYPQDSEDNLQKIETWASAHIPDQLSISPPSDVPAGQHTQEYYPSLATKTHEPSMETGESATQQQIQITEDGLIGSDRRQHPWPEDGTFFNHSLWMYSWAGDDFLGWIYETVGT